MKISFKRAGAVLYRHIFYLTKPFEIFHYWYWILIDILIFGFLGKSFCQAASAANGACISNVHILFTNLVLLYAFLRTTTTFGVSFLRDLWDANFVNLFSTPIKKVEWLLGILWMATISATLCVCIGTFLVRIIFGFSILVFGWYIPLVLVLLITTGTIIGTLMMGVLLLLGKQANPLIWAIGWLFIPISGVYYSPDVLPPLLKACTAYNPLFSIFSIIRQVGTGNTDIWPLVLHSILLMVPLAIAVALFFAYAFSVAKKHGLTRLEVEM